MTNSIRSKNWKKNASDASEKKCAADARSHFDERHQTTSGRPLLLGVSFFSFSQILFSEWSRFYHRRRWVLLLRVVPSLRKKRRTTVFVCFPDGEEAKELWRIDGGADDGDVKDKNDAFEEWK